jgi:hypothetical protein
MANCFFGFRLASSSNESTKDDTTEKSQSRRESPASPFKMSPPTTSTDRTPATRSSFPSIPPVPSEPIIYAPSLPPEESQNTDANSSSSNAGNPHNMVSSAEGALPSRAPRPNSSVSASRRRFSGSTATSAAGSEPEGKQMGSNRRKSYDADHKLTST